MQQIAIVGAGFSGAVVARELATFSSKFRISVFDERSHVAGNCHTERDDSTGVMLHCYGPHIFHTDKREVWDYICQFGEMGPYTNRVKAVTKRGVFSLPINLLTINQFFGMKLGPKEAAEFIANKGDASIKDPQNFEEQALKFLGRELYENFFYGYSKKQWGVEPRLLPASILKRLPIRFNYDDNYYTSRYQGIPVQGYSDIVQKILSHPHIEVLLNQRFSADMAKDFHHVFYSGPVDGYFNYSLGRLRYRSLIFERFEADGDFQGNPVVNYCDESVPHTRISEHKHFAPWEEHARTVCYKEYSKATEAADVPFYPVRLEQDKGLLNKYLELAAAEPKVTFFGRLGSYRYLDMHVVIAEALELAKKCLAEPDRSEKWPKVIA